MTPLELVIGVGVMMIVFAHQIDTLRNRVERLERSIGDRPKPC